MIFILYEKFKSNNVYYFTMNKTMTITVIALVAVVMGMAAVAPMIPDAFAHNAPDQAHKICEPDALKLIPAELIERLCGHYR